MANSRLIRLCSTRSLRLPGYFVGIAAKGSAGMGDEFRAAALDEVAGFGDDVFQDFENLAHTGCFV